MQDDDIQKDPFKTVAVEEDSYSRRLLHRWLVQYNPLYLLSATLVLGGMFVLSRGLAAEGSEYGALGVAAIAEVYAFALIGGAALLTRIGHRRPGVLLALLTAVYQCDLTLHTETCPNLGTIGGIAAAAWFAFFMVKLLALAWAVRVRLSAGALVTAGLGALGLAALPHWLIECSPAARGSMIAIWISAVVCAHRFSKITSTTELDAWGETVLRRSVSAIWGIWGVILSLHVLFWGTNSSIHLDTLLCVAPLLLLTRLVRGEIRMWSVVGASLAFIALKVPAGFSTGAFIAASVLLLRAIKPLTTTIQSIRRAPQSPSPYRMGEVTAEQSEVITNEIVLDLDVAARLRLFVGSLFAFYTSLWTFGWDGGGWPAHKLALDIVLVVLVALAVWRKRTWFALAPLSATMAHFAIVRDLVPQPGSSLQWGAFAVTTGFVLLIASVAASYWLSRSAAARLRNQSLRR